MTKNNSVTKLLRLLLRKMLLLRTFQQRNFYYLNSLNPCNGNIALFFQLTTGNDIEINTGLQFRPA